MPPKIKHEATSLAAPPLSCPRQNSNKGEDYLSIVARLFSDVHLSSTTHGESRRKLVKLFDEANTSSSTSSNNNTTANNIASTTNKLAELLEAIRKVTLAACCSLDDTAVTRHSRFLHQLLAQVEHKARLTCALQLIHGIYQLHNAPDEKTRFHIMTVLCDLVRVLPDVGDSQTPSWFSEFAEVLKLRSRDKNWQVREQSVNLLSAFNSHRPDDDITQFIHYIGAEETRTEVRRTLLKNIPPKAVYFSSVLRFLDDKVAAIRKQAWILFGQYDWLRVEAYAVRTNLIARVAAGLTDGAKPVQAEVGRALQKWIESRELYLRQKYQLEQQKLQQQKAQQNQDDDKQTPQHQHAALPQQPHHFKVSATELLDMMTIGLRNLLVNPPSAEINSRGHNHHQQQHSNATTETDVNPIDQPDLIAIVAEHLYREHDAKVEKKKEHRRKLLQQQHQQQQQQALKNASAVSQDADDIPLVVALGGNIAAHESAAELNAPLPYPLVTDGMTVANLSLWAAHCRAAVGAGKTDLEERLLPPLRVFATILSDSIEIFHTHFSSEPVDPDEEKRRPDHQRGIRSKSGNLRVYHPCESELVLHILMRSFMLYHEAGYLGHIDHESSSLLVATFKKLLTTTMDPPTMFVKEAVEGLYAVCQQTRNVGDPVTLAIDRLFTSLSLVRNYGVTMEDSEGFGRYDTIRRTQLRGMQLQEKAEEFAQAASVLANQLQNDNLYMIRMQHIALEYLNARARNDRTTIPTVIDHVIRLGREWGDVDGVVREVSTRALGMYCLANPMTVPTYIGLLIHNAAAAPETLQQQQQQQQSKNNNNNNSNNNIPLLEAQRKHRLASVAASFDVLCEFGPGFFKRQPHNHRHNDNTSDHNDSSNNRADDSAESQTVQQQPVPQASFDVQQWDRYVTTLQSLTVDRDGAVRRLSSLGVSKMLACNRFHSTDALLCGMALVQLYYVSPTQGDLLALQQLLSQRLVSPVRLLQEKCQINHANDSFLFFLKAFSSSTPKRMKQTLDGGLLALRLLLRRARVSSPALLAATKFVKRLISITDSCSLEQVRDIDPRIAEAAKERIMDIAAEQNNLNNSGGNSSMMTMSSSSNLLQQQHQIQQLLMGNEGSDSSSSSFHNAGTLSLPPLKDEAGNDLFEVAKSNPVLWTLLASHSQHETLAEFLLESLREGCCSSSSPSDQLPTPRNSSSSRKTSTITTNNNNNDNNSNNYKKKTSPAKGKGQKQRQQQQKQDDDDGDNDGSEGDSANENADDDETTIVDDSQEVEHGGEITPRLSVKKEEQKRDAEEESLTAPDTLECKMLCARSLSNLQLYKRDHASVTRMCGMILRAQTDVQEKFPEVAAVINRFGLAYAKSCGRKGLGDGGGGVTASARNSSHRGSTGALLADSNTDNKNASVLLLSTVLGSRDGPSAWRKLMKITGEAVDQWFVGDLRASTTVGGILASQGQQQQQAQRRGRIGSSASSTTTSAATGTRYGPNVTDETLMNAFNVSATRRR